MCIISSSITIAGITISAAVANTMLGIGAVATIAGVASGIVGGISSYQQGKAQQAQAEYQAKVAEDNARIAQQNASNVRQEGIEESRMQRMKTLQTVSSQQASMAANGLDISQGTPLDVIEDTATMGELDALTTQYNSETKAQAYEQQANNFNNQANLDRIAGRNAMQAGKMNALSSGLNTVSSLGKSVSNYWWGFAK